MFFILFFVTGTCSFVSGQETVGITFEVDSVYETFQYKQKGVLKFAHECFSGEGLAFHEITLSPSDDLSTTWKPNSQNRTVVTGEIKMYFPGFIPEPCKKYYLFIRVVHPDGKQYFCNAWFEIPGCT